MDRERTGSARPPAEDAAVTARVGPDGVRCIDAAELLAGDREVVIAHAGQRYRLRLTASGKLILTK